MLKLKIQSLTCFLSLVTACGTQDHHNSRSSKIESQNGPEASDSLRDADLQFLAGTKAVKSAEVFNPTCSSSLPTKALDIDGDGTVNHFTDGALLMLLMTNGSPVSKRKAFIQPGIRTDFDLYYDKVLSKHLDVNGDGKINPYVDGVLIVSFMQLAGQPQMQRILKDLKGDAKKIESLSKLVLLCNQSQAHLMHSNFGLEKKESFFIDWGGKGNIWFWSSKKKVWLFMDRSGMLRIWTKTSDTSLPVKGKEIGLIDRYYHAHPELLITLQ